MCFPTLESSLVQRVCRFARGYQEYVAECQNASFSRVRHVSLVITLLRQHCCLTNGTCSAKDLVFDDVLYSQHPSVSLCLDNVERSSILTN